ncbi:hypothetical protein HanPSC8_Chr16g0729651 [Helianthus annuus]|nr:hypothetical protein HanPSC8_Chr16g0729651 [Helianthus annuus]
MISVHIDYIAGSINTFGYEWVDSGYVATQKGKIKYTLNYKFCPLYTSYGMGPLKQ